jgi:hypothetical protein
LKARAVMEVEAAAESLAVVSEEKSADREVSPQNPMNERRKVHCVTFSAVFASHRLVEVLRFLLQLWTKRVSCCSSAVLLLLWSIVEREREREREKVVKNLRFPVLYYLLILWRLRCCVTLLCFFKCHYVRLQS